MGVVNMQRAVQEAESVLQSLPAISSNVHYRIPRRSKDIYTGRYSQMKAIEDAFSASIPPIQKRLVIQGQPGTGKTEMTLKYAEEHARQYWGVFWVDASSSANTMLSYAKIAEIGGVERNENAAKHWLSSCVSPWLLIVDNADDDEPLEELLPLGTQGHIIVTTRNRRHISYNIRGCSALELGAMDDEEAKVLLLRAAHEPTPWTDGTAKLAMEVCRHLHFLPLALIQAGKAIITNVCKLANYISHFEDEADRIYRERQRRRRQQSSPSFSRQVRADKESMNVFGSYEILHQSLIGAARKEERFRDALQLLHIFSYMHFQNIRLDILVQAAVAPLREAAAVEARQRQEAILLRKLGIVTPPQSWRAWLQDLARSVVASSATPVVLPDALKNPDNLDADELEKDIWSRLREALGVLVSRSLVLETPITTDSKPESHRGVTSNETERFHMHPVVHKWIRERPQDNDSAAHDALVCQYAKTILMRAIMLQGGDTPAETEMRREMRPHIDHVRACDAGIHRQFQKNRQSRAPGFLLSLSRNEFQEPVFGPLQAQEYARYARVYLECGSFPEANALLERVESYLVERVGNHHALTHRVRLARSETLFALTFWNDATKLLSQVYESQQFTLGKDHPETLRCASRLAASILTQGRITHALELCEATYNRMVKVYGPDHVESLKCVQQMARCHSYFLNTRKAISLFGQALKGMTTWLEARLASPPVDSDTNDAADPNDQPSESDVLYLQHEFACELIKDTSPTGRMRFAEAEQLLTQTAARRSALSGKEHPLSLLTLASLGRAMAANGRTAEATQLMGETLEVAERNHGSDNLAVLAGKAWYAAALALHGDLAAAERYFREASDKTKYAKASADGEHPDRIGHAWLLADVLVRRSKLAEALELCLDLRKTLPKVGGHGLGSKHPLVSNSRHHLLLVLAGIRAKRLLLRLE
jgi:tetratricopeptide (TPR) repeat protein